MDKNAPAVFHVVSIFFIQRGTKTTVRNWIENRNRRVQVHPHICYIIIRERVIQRTVCFLPFYSWFQPHFKEYCNNNNKTAVARNKKGQWNGYCFACSSFPTFSRIVNTTRTRLAAVFFSIPFFPFQGINFICTISDVLHSQLKIEVCTRLTTCCIFYSYVCFHFKTFLRVHDHFKMHTWVLHMRCRAPCCWESGSDIMKMHGGTYEGKQKGNNWYHETRKKCFLIKLYGTICPVTHMHCIHRVCA